jgi:hypothetical protein
MLTEVRLLQSENAPYPIAVTLAGMLIEARLLHLINALFPIDVTPEGIV